MAMDLSQLLSGLNNPTFKSFAGNALSDLGYGLTRGKNLNEGFQLATQRTAEMDPMRTADAEKRQLAAEGITAQNRSVAWLRTQPGGEKFAAMLENGLIDGSTAVKSWLDASRGQAPQNPYMSAGDGQFFNWQTGEYVNNPNAQPDAANVPSGYRVTANGYEAIPGGPADPNNPLNAKKTAMGDLSAAETRALFDAEDSIQAGQNVVTALDTALNLNSNSRSGWGAELSANVGANLPDWVPFVGGNDATDANTLQLKNIVTEQALSQLKLLFGGNVSDGERQILLEIQGSVNQPEEVRRRIFERAKELAVKRIKFNEDRKARIETGGYGVVNGGTRTGGGAYTVIGVE